MTGLADAQARLGAWLLGRGDAPADLVASGAGAGADAASRLAVYRDAHGLRLVAALRENHPVVHTVLGDAAFAELGRAYAAACPSRDPSIRWFGDRLAGFLADHPAWAGHPWLAELAAFEWALGAAFDGPDAVPADAAAVAAVPPGAWAGLRFEPLATARLLTLRWSVVATWRAVQAGDAAPPRPHRLDAPVTWAVWRPAERTLYRSLEEDEGEALAALAAGAPFGALCDRLAERHGPEAAAGRAAGLLGRWLAEGLIGAVRR
ncbi:HvfC/BufC family peptide modification chaperone [Azospirillum sp. ST 5-10]|uniref:HvfC/BufC family peptide modification chaperone n=1 Tax=unclassified Azospirillum TaxID=2630922 RepID=UPI003F49F140